MTGPEEQFQLGGAQYASGHFVEAEQAYRALLEGDHPRMRMAVSALFRIALLKNRLDEAAQWLGHARTLGVALGPLAGWMLEYALRTGDFGAAADCARAGGDRPAAAYWTALSARTPYALRGAAGHLPLVYADPLPVVDVWINGQPARCLVDTGADHLLLDDALAERAGACRSGIENEARFAGGVRSLQDGWVDELVLDACTLTTVPAQILSFRTLFQEFAGRAVEAVLGMRLLSLFRVTLDYGAGHLTLTPRGTRPLRGGAPLWLAPGGRPITPMTLDGTYRGLGLLDSGCMGLALAAHAPVLAQLLGSGSGPLALAAGGGGLTEIAPVTLKVLEAAGRTQTDAPAAALADFPMAYQFGFRLDGFLGHAFLRGGTLELDFDCMRVLLDSSRDLQA